MAKQYLIIGNSAAGIAAVEAIRRRDTAGLITVVSDEDYPAYCRCLISYYLAGDVKEDKIFYRAASFYKENNVELILNKKVTRVDPKKNRVICEDKSQLSYDALLIATGSHPRIPEIKGIKKKGVFGFRTIKDAKDIEGLLFCTDAICVLGGGLVGLKAAYALKKRKVAVKVIVKSDQILSQMLDFPAAGLVQRRLEENGIEVIAGQDITEVIGEGEIRAVKLDSGKALECSMVIIGKGVRANMDLVKDTEVKVNRGIIANSDLKTNIPNIFSAGDVSETFDLALGEFSVNTLWTAAVGQGKIAGANMSGENINYAGSIAANATEFFGLPVVSLGVHKIKEGSSGYEQLVVKDEKSGFYKKVILKDNFVSGAILVGDIKNSGVLLRLIKERIDVSSFKEKLLQDNFGFPDIIDFVKEEEKIYV